ncbi:Transcription initiation factor TFIIE subunit alpha [Gigaspora margarita]|uniref:Transcription initiation factor TFIIE subunit alpha n=1 Tax=Gigaspora margarita TaxID=4874 RepID=A0A8H4AHF1_GIGMA|nr:Transcription initiation factor TFIIE subunit alpha [Gigaspora margarita]KAF0495226.1 Transcription initiation factor TFIIE subunit alpha [Gigaspora margarita]
MEEKTDMTVFIALLMRVARAFFQTPQIVVLDYLTKHETAISDENLAKGVGLTVKEIHKLCGTLKEARLIKTFTKAEPKKAEQRAIPRTFYYIDWQQVVNVIKWKIYRIREMVGDRMRNEQENKGYLCTGCKKTFAPLEIRNLFDTVRSTLVCDLCHTELIHNDNAENVKDTEKLHGRFMEQSQPIIDLLKVVDKLVIPVSSIDKLQATSGVKGEQQGPMPDVPYARNHNLHMEDIVVVFKDDNEATKTERQNQQSKIRQQNALPAWHIRSTVTGEVMANNAVNTGSTQENEQSEESGRTNENDSELENFYAEYYANLNNSDASPMVDDDDEFEEEIFGGDEFEEVKIEEEDDDEFIELDVESDERGSKRSRIDSFDGNNGRYISRNGSRY